MSESFSCPFHHFLYLKVYIDYVSSLSTASDGMPGGDIIPTDLVKIPDLVSGVELNFEKIQGNHLNNRIHNHLEALGNAVEKSF